MRVKTYLRTHQDDSTSGYVWVEFYIEREKIHFSTKVPVAIRDWSEKTLRVKTTDRNATDKNLIIDTVLSRINDVFVKYRLKDKRLTKDAFLRAYNRPTDYVTFFDFVKEQFRKHSRQMRDGTFYSHKYVMDKVKNYAPNLVFDDLDKEWLDNYYLFLRNELDNNANTAYKNMAILKKYVRIAYKLGYLDINPFEDWKIKRGTPSCTYLTENELNKLISIYQNGEMVSKYHKTLEFFLFMCFSSLHVGDAKRLKLEQFGQDTFTYYRLKLETRKPEPIVVPISEPLRAIVKNVVGSRRRGRVFEEIFTDQSMNRYLKYVAEYAGIEKTLTHKVGRHTFATIFLRKTKDLAALKEILGHSDISETLIYAHVLDESKIEGVQCFNEFKL